MSVVIDGLLTIPLYHGTSSLFLDSICKNGLAGRNPVKDWSILELAKDVSVLSQRYLSDFEMFDENTFRLMVEQKITSGNMNFQHGDTYMSPSRETAIKYAANKLYGSEIIDRTLYLLRELVRREINEVKKDLFRKYPDGFRLLEISPAPILIKAENIPIEILKDELGNEALNHLAEIENNLKGEFAEILNQQLNFRLVSPIAFSSLEMWLINVIQSSAWGTPEYTLYNLTKCK